MNDSAKPYLLIFNDYFGERDSILESLDKIDGITHWYTLMPSAIFLTSTRNASELSEALEAIREEPLQPSARYAFFRVSGTDGEGRLSRKAWNLVNNPENPRIEEEPKEERSKGE